MVLIRRKEPGEAWETGEESAGGGGDWQAAAFENNWVDAAGGGLAPDPQAAEYRKDGDVVSIRGLISDGDAGAVAFTLPAGYRPLATVLFETFNASSGARNIGSVGTDGAVNVDIGASGATLYFACDFATS